MGDHGWDKCDEHVIVHTISEFSDILITVKIITTNYTHSCTLDDMYECIISVELIQPLSCVNFNFSIPTNYICNSHTDDDILYYLLNGQCRRYDNEDLSNRIFSKVNDKFINCGDNFCIHKDVLIKIMKLIGNQ